MPPEGGSGVGGPPRGVDIMRNMFEAAQAKPTDAQQQAANLRQQTQTQEQTREAPREGARPEGAPREGGTREGSRLREGGEPLVRESDLDGFLSRNSNQSQQRDAGRTLTKPQTLSSMGANAWGVANSPHTPDSARALIHLRQQAQANPQAGTNPNANTAGRPTTGTGTPSTLPQALPTLPRAPLTGERVAPLLIHYARAYSSGGETAARAFTGRGFNPETFLNQIQRMMQNQMGTGAQAFGQNVNVAVQVRGNLVFVKDGKEFRAFRLNKDGSLSELPSEDGGDHPLSPEAESMLGKVLRQKGLHLRREGGSLKESDKAQHAEGDKLHEARLEKNQEAVEGELDFETRFALLLHEVLEGDHDLEAAAAGGEEPVFAAKGDWEGFFARMLKMGNQEKGSKKAMEAVLAMIFRGMFKKEGQGNVLVGDLKFMQDAKTKEEKFAQVAVDDETFLKLLAGLRPGNKISAEQLKEVFGDELNFTELEHIAEQLQVNMAEESAKNVVFNAKGQFDPYSQARIERSILSTRRPPTKLAAGSEGGAAALPLPDPGPQGVPANVFEMLGMRERYRGKPRLYTFIVYSIALTAIGIGVAALLLQTF